MKITDLKIHVLKSPLAEPFAFSQGWVRQRSATLLEIFTDEGIIEAAATKDCDLIFMASHGRRGLTAMLLGSETTRVLTHTRIPVMVYR